MSFEQLRRQVTQFWEETYTAYSLEERRTHWLAHFKKGVDWERSQGADPYSVFEPEAYQSWCEQESSLPLWLAELSEALGLDAEEVARRVATDNPSHSE